MSRSKTIRYAEAYIIEALSIEACCPTSQDAERLNAVSNALTALVLLEANREEIRGLIG